jgi:hypothetical protein
MTRAIVLPTERHPQTERAVSRTDESVAVGDRPASLGIQGLKVCLAVALPLLWPDDPIEALVAIMDVGLHMLPFAGDFSADAGLNVLVAVRFGKSTQSQYMEWQALRKCGFLPVELQLTTLHWARPVSRLIAWEVEDREVSSAEKVEILYVGPLSF